MSGNTFIIADYAQIEARILSWLAGQDDLTQDFAEGKDPYSKFATRLFNVPIRKPIDDDPEPVKAYLSVKRGFGKDAVLGCGFGMGASTFYDRCIANESLRPLFDSGAYDMLFISKLIKTYRGTYTKIPKFWNSIEKAFRWVIKHPKMGVYYRDGEIKAATDWGDCFGMPEDAILGFYNDNGTVCIRLPSSRVLFYPHARIAGRKLAYHWSNKLWGGFLTENVVQAIARDIMAESLLGVHNRVCPVVLHGHDELVCLSSKELKVANVARIQRIMEHVPHWCEGLPIAVEIDTSGVYKK
ncbi:DNA polymerase [Neptuniibacter sp.]|uniref:DNA polymerase n=1 Tax=Neptuniibacter sp. TaxID=1962643 RepID=UPI00262E781D|nr:DNA polymerase [Neptuniibacter sp.]MCP4596229.1 hypothetical protein [Neptuniibacter sp.]